MSEEEKALINIEKGNLSEIANVSAEMGLDVAQEVEDQNKGMMAQPFLKVEHDNEGLHGFKIQLQEGIVDHTGIIRLGTREKPVTEVKIQILLHKPTRSYFPDPTAKMPECASIDGHVLGFIQKSFNDGKKTCEGCPLNKFGADCKPRIRALIGMPYKFEEAEEEQIYAFLFWIPPGSLSSWNKLTKKCKASKVPVQSFVLDVKLEDIIDGNLRYAKMGFYIDKVLGEKEIAFGKETITKLRKIFDQSSEAEYSKGGADSEKDETRF